MVWVWNRLVDSEKGTWSGHNSARQAGCNSLKIGALTTGDINLKLEVSRVP